MNIRFSILAFIASMVLIFPGKTCASAIGRIEELMEPPIVDWSDITSKDLDRIHEIVSESHPAKLDPANRDFNDWLVLGHKKAMLLANQSKSKEQSWATLNYYLTGFMDQHLALLRDANSSDQLYWAGWHMKYANGRYQVASHAIDWPVDLPQIGDELISCDGVEVKEILRSKVAPFVDSRMYLDNTLDRLSKHLTAEQAHSPLWDPLRSKKCIIRKPNGDRHELPLLWQKQAKTQKIGHHPRPQQGMHQIKTGVYWIHASNFMLNAEDYVKFENLLDQIRTLDAADAIVLDTRGNRGGNSMVGARLLLTLLQDAIPSRENAKAYWRVSPLARASLKSHRASTLKIEGKDGLGYKWINGLYESMEAAALRDELLVEQIDVSITYDKKMASGKPPFKGKLVLITDSHCSSACLDFVDDVMSVPGVLHVGSTTDADTRYIDVGTETLPSGLKIWVPLKVWVGRRRQDNVPYVPQIKYEQNLNDTEAVQAWVLQSILPLAKNIEKP